MSYTGLAGKWVMHSDKDGHLWRTEFESSPTVSEVTLKKNTSFKMVNHTGGRQVIAATQIKGWVYYLTYTSPSVQLERVRPNGTEKTILVDKLYEMGALGEYNQFPDPQAFLHATRNGQWLIYRTPKGDMYKVQTNGKKNQLLLGSSTGIYQIVSALTTNDWIYYVRDDTTNRQTIASEIYRIKIDGSNNSLVKSIPEYKSGTVRQTLMVSEDGKWMLYTLGRGLHAFSLSNIYEEYKIGDDGQSLPYASAFILDNKIHALHDESDGFMDYDKWDIETLTQGFKWKNWADVDDKFIANAGRTAFGPTVFQYMPDLALAPELTYEEDKIQDTPVSSFIQSGETKELLEGSGAFAKITLTLQKPEICSQISIKLFTKYPIELISVQYEEDTEVYYKPKELIHHIEEKEATGILKMMFPAVLAKRFTIIINQKNFEKNVYLIKEDKLNDKDLWAKITAREAEITLDTTNGLETVDQGDINSWSGWNIYLNALQKYQNELKAWQAEVEKYNKDYAKYENELQNYYGVWTEFEQTLRSYGYRYNNIDETIQNWQGRG